MSLQRFTVSSGSVTMALTSVVLAFSTLPIYAQSLGKLAGTPAPATAAILGEVRNTTGVAQMGATVQLYDRYDNLVRHGLSTETGRFAFAALVPDVYTVRVTLASFIPAVKRNITILAGTENLLNISLATVLSTITIVPGSPGRATLMNDDWKWVLRSSQSTRPVLRLVAPPTAKEATLFSDFTGLVRVSGGDSNLLNSALQQDMATAFAVESSVAGDTKVRVSGSLGYSAASGLPSAGLRTTFMHERNGVAGPQLALTVRQAYFPTAFGSGSGSNTPLLRTASLSTIDSMDLLDGLRLDYGASVDSVMLFGRLNYFSPFARATYQLGAGSQVKAAYSSGFAPVELLSRQPEGQADLTQDLTALGQAPRISRRDDHAAVERTKSYEVAWQVN
ncbi:MAG: carboxypeptidase-like regulatory domain-containing protein, partial [Acidobacteriota bacterium]